MNREALLTDGPPAQYGANCCHCGRWTYVPVPCARTGNVTLHTCPHCLLLPIPPARMNTSG